MCGSFRSHSLSIQKRLYFIGNNRNYQKKKYQEKRKDKNKTIATSAIFIPYHDRVALVRVLNSFGSSVSFSFFFCNFLLLLGFCIKLNPRR